MIQTFRPVGGYRIDPRVITSVSAAVLEVLEKPENKQRVIGHRHMRVRGFDIEPSAEAMIRFMESLLHFGTGMNEAIAIPDPRVRVA